MLLTDGCTESVSVKVGWGFGGVGWGWGDEGRGGNIAVGNDCC